MRAVATFLVLLATGTALLGQTPQPFPRVRPSAPAAGNAEPPRPAPAAASPQAASQAAAPAQPADPNAPASTAVGFPVYPNAQFLASYDAGKQQRFFYYGTTAAYAEVVKFYQTALKDRGDQVFAVPATHMFAQRFREETMAFPPGVTVKDWTANGSLGYPNAKPGGQPARFPTVIMIVPAPPDAGVPAR